MDIVGELAPTGTLRVSINIGNPVLAQGTPDAPSGVTVDIARELGKRLGVPVGLRCFPTALGCFDAVSSGEVDVCFLAIEPERAEAIAFTAPYVLIEGVFAVPEGSPLMSPEDVDRLGVRIGVSEGSAYDLYLTRSLLRAELVRSGKGVTTFTEQQLEATAGVRQSIEAFAASHPGVRLIEPAFMEIRQAVGTSKNRDEQAIRFLYAFVEELKAEGFVGNALMRSGQDAAVAPLASGRPAKCNRVDEEANRLGIAPPRREPEGRGGRDGDA